MKIRLWRLYSEFSKELQIVKKLFKCSSFLSTQKMQISYLHFKCKLNIILHSSQNDHTKNINGNDVDMGKRELLHIVSE